ncbi:MAG: hypothetical protein P4M07_06440 [Xanthobacteraceae bacterium]|nr:hypothetical protein [Xanthobacteraceae bacterium]
MNDPAGLPKHSPPAVARRRSSRSTDANAEDPEWKRADELLDEALRETFPASDALSITRTAP